MLDVVIVSYRCEAMLRGCLRSLRDHPPAGGLRVTVVDNASGDGTADAVRRDFPEVRLVDCAVGDGASIEMAVGYDAEVGPHAVVGPYAVLRPGSHIPPGATTGSFYTAVGSDDEGV